jgi:hypothetical protein
MMRIEEKSQPFDCPDLDLLRVDPERRFFPRLKRWGLAPPNGSRQPKIDSEKASGI